MAPRSGPQSHPHGTDPCDECGRARWGHERPPEETPDADTIGRWVGEDDWHLLAQEEMAKHSKAWHHRQFGRLMMLQDRAISEHDAILRGERDHLPAAALNARVALIKMGYETTGVGTYGAKYAAPEIPPPPGLADGADLTPLQRMERTRRKALGLGLETGTSQP